MSAYEDFIAAAAEAREVELPDGPRGEVVGVHRFLERCAEGGSLTVLGPEGDSLDVSGTEARADLIEALEALHEREPPEQRDVSDAERQGVASAEPDKQYAHFLSQAAGGGEVWALVKGGEDWAARRDGDARLFPVWLHVTVANDRLAADLLDFLDAVQ